MSFRESTPFRCARLVLAMGFSGLCWGQQTGPVTAPQQTDPDSRVVISVGEQKITAAGVQRILKALPPQSRVYYSGPGLPMLPLYLVRMKVLNAEAAKLDIERDPEVQQAIELARESIVAEAVRKQFEKKVVVSDQQLQEAYQQRREEFEQVRIRRILVRTEGSLSPPSASPDRPPLPATEARAKIEDLQKQIQSGTDFADLARVHSEDLATAGKGGDVGYLTRQTALVLPPVVQTAFALKIGQVSDRIVTAYGYELIKVEDRRTKPFAEVRATLEEQIRQMKTEELIQQLQRQYPVEIDSTFFIARATAKGAPTPSRPK